MGIITLEKLDNNSVFFMPSVIVDKYINVASLTDLKVIMYLIRHMGKSLNEEEIQKSLNIDQDKLDESINFWVLANVLSKKNGRLSLCYGATYAQKDKLPDYTGDVILKRSEKDNVLKALLSQAEAILNTTLSSADISVLYGMYDHLSMEPQVILTLISYCMQNGKKSMRYIEKVALDWADRQITDIQSCNNYLFMLEEQQKIENKIKKVFGISDRALTEKEKSYITKWTIDFGYDENIIKLAYEKNVDLKGSFSFAYINSILTRWHECGYTSVEQIDNEAKPVKKSEYITTDWEIIKNGGKWE